MPQYKLTYFQLRGKGEAIRMTLSVAGVEFEDVRISIDDWVSKFKHCEYTVQFWLILHNSIVYAHLNRKDFSSVSAISFCADDLCIQVVLSLPLSPVGAVQGGCLNGSTLFAYDIISIT